MLPDTPRMDDLNECARAAQAGDQRAFGELVRQLNGNVYGQLLRMTRDPEKAKELAQQTWINAWRKLPSFRFEAAFSSWLYRIATFAALDAFRKEARRKEVSFDNLPAEGSEAAPFEARNALPEQLRQIEARELEDCLESAIAALPEPQRQTILLREKEGLSYAAIAAKLRCKPGTVMSRLFHARQAIQNHLANYLSS